MTLPRETFGEGQSLEVANVNLSFGQTRALRDVTVSFHRGINGVLGVNGAGKTTLIRLLAGQLRADGGEASYGGVSSLDRAYRRRVSILPQHYTFPGNYRAREFVAFAAWLKGEGNREARLLADEALHAVGLTDYGDARMRALSGGMRRRAGFASALVGDPGILLLDEPTTGVDPEQRATLRDLIRRQGEERIVVFSSHVLEDVEALADRVVILHEGSIVADQSVEELVVDSTSRQVSRSSLEDAFLRQIRGVDK